MAPTVELLTTAEVAERFRVHPSTVRRWIASGEIEALATPGGSHRIPASEVERLLAGQAQPSAGVEQSPVPSERAS